MRNNAVPGEISIITHNGFTSVKTENELQWLNEKEKERSDHLIYRAMGPSA